MRSLFQGRTAPRSPRRRSRAVPMLEQLDERTLPSVMGVFTPGAGEPTAPAGPVFSPTQVYRLPAPQPAPAPEDPIAPAQPPAIPPTPGATPDVPPSPILDTSAQPEQPIPVAVPLVLPAESATPAPPAPPTLPGWPAQGAEQAAAATASVVPQDVAMPATTAVTAVTANGVSPSADGEHKSSPVVVAAHPSGRPSNSSESPAPTPDSPPAVGGKGEEARAESPSHTSHDQAPPQSPSHQRRPAGAGAGADDVAAAQDTRELFLSDDGEALPTSPGELPPAGANPTPAPKENARPGALMRQGVVEGRFVVGLDLVAPGERAVDLVAPPVPVAEDAPVTPEAAPAPAGGIGLGSAAWGGFDGLTATPVAAEGGTVGTFELLGGIALALVLRPIERTSRGVSRLEAD